MPRPVLVHIDYRITQSVLHVTQKMHNLSAPIKQLLGLNPTLITFESRVISQ